MTCVGEGVGEQLMAKVSAFAEDGIGPVTMEPGRASANGIAQTARSGSR